MNRCGWQARVPARCGEAAATCLDVPVTETTVDRGVPHPRRRIPPRTGPAKYAEAAARLPVPEDGPQRPLRLPPDRPRRRPRPGRHPREVDRPCAIHARRSRAGLLTVVVARPPRFGDTVTRSTDHGARGERCRRRRTNTDRCCGLRGGYLAGDQGPPCFTSRGTTSAAVSAEASNMTGAYRERRHAGSRGREPGRPRRCSPMPTR